MDFGWFCQKALEIKNHTLVKPFTISGTRKQVRDVLHGEDVVNLHFTAKDIDKAYGEVFNIGGGIENSLLCWNCLICLRINLILR